MTEPKTSLVRRMMICKKKVTWGGKICYGKSFQINIDKDDKCTIICDKCGQEQDIKIKIEE